MGYISNLAKGTKKETTLPGADQSRRLWREVFGTDKETPAKPKVTPGGSWGRSTVSGDAAFTRLLQAMRSMAPGGWSDDRWEQTRHYTGIPYVATDRLGRRLSRAEFQVFAKDPNHPDGKRPITENDPPQGDRQVKPYDLVKLLESPNNQDHFGLLMWRWKQQLNLTGMALTWMVPNVFGAPTELYCVPTAIAIPQPAINPDYPDGYYRIQPVYPYGPFSSYPTPNSAVGAAVPAQWMLRFLYPHPLLRYDGYSPMTGMRLHIDEAEMIDRSRHYAMRREVNPSAVISFDEVSGMESGLPPEEVNRIHAEFENTLQGPENAGRLFVNHVPGQKLEPWGSSPIDMDYQNGWDQLTNFILGGGFGITKPAAGMIEDSSYASLYATLKQLDLVTLDPDCYLIAAYLTRNLACFFGDNLIVEVRCPRIDDHDIKFTKIDKLQAGKAITKNELRKELDMPLTQEAWGADIAGDPSAAEQQQQEEAMAQEQQMVEGGPMQEPGPGQEAAEEEEPAEVTASRPKPGPLGEGSRGPQMKKLVHGEKGYVAPDAINADLFKRGRRTNNPNTRVVSKKQVEDALLRHAGGFYTMSGVDRGELSTDGGATEYSTSRSAEGYVVVKLKSLPSKPKTISPARIKELAVSPFRRKRFEFSKQAVPVQTKSLYEKMTEVVCNGHG